MKKKFNIVSKPDFVLTLIGLVTGVFIAVGTIGFLSIPYSLSGHPGEVRVGAAHSTTGYHAT